MAELLTYRCERDSEAPLRARALLRRLLADADRERAQDAALVVSELMTNAVRHGAGEATLVVHRDGRRVNVAVSDEGQDMPNVRGPTAAGGWGLHIVDACADRWGVEAGSTHVWFEMGLTGEGSDC